MREIGAVVRLQIQRSSLKTGEKPHRVYDPSPVLSVRRLAVDGDGVLGEGEDQSRIVDVHHRAHPRTKNPDGLHGVAVGFTSHYDAMRQRFSDRVTLGCAGENIVGETSRRFTLEGLAAGLVCVGTGGAEVVRLGVLDVAHPCRPFTGWALGNVVESEVLKSHLQFLDGGTRGFYCRGEGAGIVSLGDRLVLVERWKAGGGGRGVGPSPFPRPFPPSHRALTNVR